MSDGITHSYRAARAADSFEELYRQAMEEYWLLGDKRTYKNLSVAKLMEFILTYSKYQVEIRKKNYFLHKQFGLNDIRECVDDSKKKFYDIVPLYSIDLNVNGVHKGFYHNLSLRDALEHAYVFTEWANTPEGKEACDKYNDW